MNTLWIVDIEPLDNRYTKQWQTHIPELAMLTPVDIKSQFCQTTDLDTQEAQIGDYVGEDDIVRIQDDYAR